MVEMRVAGIALDAASRSPIVLLRDPSGRRQVPIWIDQAQAHNILAGLDHERPPRPLSHDLMVSLLEAGGLTLERVIIHTIEENTFRAVLKLRSAAGETTELDARPSDAIALALRTGSGIWMLEEVVADASMPVDAEADAEEEEDFRRFLDRTSPAELIRHLRASGVAEGEPPADSEATDSEAIDSEATDGQVGDRELGDGGQGSGGGEEGDSAAPGSPGDP